MSTPSIDARVLRAIRTHGPVRAGAVADRLGLSVPDVSASVRRLKRAGAIRSKGQTRGQEHRAA